MLDDRILTALAGSVFALSLVACGGGGGGGGSTPASPGWLVAQRFDAGQEGVSVYPADQASPAAVETVAGAMIRSDVFGAGSGLAFGNTVAYQTKNGDEVGLFISNKRVVLGNQAGHTYAYLFHGTAGNRIFVRDTVAGVASLLSFALDGTDPRTITSGCLVQIPLPFLFASGQGLLFGCDKGSGQTVWFSDGLAPSLELHNSLNRKPRTISAGWAIMSSNDTASALLEMRPLDGGIEPGNGFLSPDAGTSQGDAFLAVGGTPGGEVLLTSRTGAATYRYWTVNPDASSPKLRTMGTANGSIAFLTADGSRAATLVPGEVGSNEDQIRLIPFAFGDTSYVDLSPGSEPADDAWLLADGKAVVRQASPVGYRVMSLDGAPGAILSSNPNDVFQTTLDQYFVLETVDTTPHRLKSFREDGSAVFTLSDNVASPIVTTTPTGRVLFQDAAGKAWAVAPDLASKVQIDPGPVGVIFYRGASGSREFYVLSRPVGNGYQNDTVSYDFATGALLTILGGPTSDEGYFVP